MTSCNSVNVYQYFRGEFGFSIKDGAKIGLEMNVEVELRLERKLERQVLLQRQ
jgi:hypothetical protein